MRVIAGTKRGHKLVTLDSLATRPTTDRVKEALFSIIMPYLSGATVLDLFSGSGSLGIEALSRGAQKAVFCDSSIKAVEIIKKNLSAVKFDAPVKNMDFKAYLNSANEKFDIIFLDPPYKSDFAIKALNLIKENGCLNEGGIISVESQSLDKLSCDGFEVLKERKYGNSKITIFTLGNGYEENDNSDLPR